MTAPLFGIVLLISEFSLRYEQLSPQPLTQIVIPSVASAPLCDAPSTPNAPQLTIIVPYFESAYAKR